MAANFIRLNSSIGRAIPSYGIGSWFKSSLRHHVAVAQLVRASGCGPEGHGFEFRQPPQNKNNRELKEIA